jgi:hypothetical protein
VEVKQPLLAAEESGQFMVMELVVVEILKLFPAVPVAKDTEIRLRLASAPTIMEEGLKVAIWMLAPAVTVSREEPVAEATVKIGVVVFKARLVPCTTNMAVGVEEPTPILWSGLTTNRDVPVEEAMLKMSLAPALPWRLKVTVEEVALMPATVPLSLIKP